MSSSLVVARLATHDIRWATLAREYGNDLVSALVLSDMMANAIPLISDMAAASSDRFPISFQVLETKSIS